MPDSLEPKLRFIPYDLAQLAAYEVAADIFALLAYPNPKEHERRVLTQRRLAGQHIRRFLADREGLLDTPMSIPPVYLLMDRRSLSTNASHLEKRWRKRQDAAATLMPFVIAAIAGEDPHKGIRSVDLKASKRRVRKRAGVEDAHNFRKRHWKDSGTVLHLAVAWCLMIREWAAAGKTGPSPFDLMQDKALLGDLLLRAEALELYLELWEPALGRLQLTVVRAFEKGVKFPRPVVTL